MSFFTNRMNKNYQSGVVHWFVIIFGILIALILIGYFTASTQPPINSGVATVNQKTCGLVVDTPKENAKITLPVMASGYLKSCTNSPLTSNYGTVQITDTNGVALGEEVKLPIIGNWVGQPAYFSVSVTTKSKPLTNSGFLVFSNHDKSGTVLKTFHIAVLFAQ